MVEMSEYEPTAERRVELDYEGYRKIVDGLNTAFRDTGIVDPAGYDRAMRDPRTVKLRIGDKLELPLFASMEHVAGYDVPRSRTLTGEEEVMVMAVPIEAMTAQDAEVVMSDEAREQLEHSAIVLETDSDVMNDVREAMPVILSEYAGFTPENFLDARIQDPEQQAANMGFYSIELAAVDEAGEAIPRRSTDFQAAFDELVEQQYPLTETTKLLDVHRLREDEATVDEIWELCKDRFEWLGDAHPVSMEDTKDFFLQVVLHEDTHTLVRYDDEGRVACLGFFISGLEECEWLSQNFRDKMTEQCEENDQLPLYFHGIASKSQNGMHYAKDIMQLLSRINRQMGGNYNVMFESTNMSGQYIPRIVEQYVKESDGLTVVESTKKVSQMDYWYLKPRPLELAA